MSKPLPSTSGHFRRAYSDEFRLIETKSARIMALAFMACLIAFPFIATSLYVDIAAQVFYAAIGALALMLLTGVSGQISLGHAGLLAAGAFTVGILYKEFGAPFWVTLPAAAVTGAVLGIIFGLPSLRLRGLYLAISTLALHFLVVYVGGEYQTLRSFSTGILVEPPVVFGLELYGPRIWYFILAAAAGLTLFICINLMRSRSGRAWRAIHSNETVAEALGIGIARYKLRAFVISSAITAVAGALFAYHRGFVSIGAFSLYLAIEYVAMIIIGGMGSPLGALLGALFVTLLPYLIEMVIDSVPMAEDLAGAIFAVNYAAFGVVVLLFLVFEPLGLVGIWRRVRNYFLLWPFRHRSAGGRT